MVADELPIGDGLAMNELVFEGAIFDITASVFALETVEAGIDEEVAETEVAAAEEADPDTRSLTRITVGSGLLGEAATGEEVIGEAAGFVEAGETAAEGEEVGPA